MFVHPADQLRRSHQRDDRNFGAVAIPAVAWLIVPAQGPVGSLRVKAAAEIPANGLTPINVTLRAAEEAGFEVRDVESLREHYALTLRHWVRRPEAQHDQALKFVDESTYGVWRLYMSGSAHGFTTGRLNVYQALLIKPDV